jgi:ABC-type transport system involved in multi-copper enzyme maturation permease subunit
MVHTLSDFPDALSPMVVKELRQGLRQKFFVTTLIIVHLVMAVCMLFFSSIDQGMTLTGVLETVSSIFMILVIPMQLSKAILNETKANTLEMLRLSQMSAGRIIWGKWLSNVLQNGLLAVSLLPYLIVSYHFGGMDLLASMLSLGHKLLLGMVIAAAALALSSFQRAWASLLIGLAVYFLFAQLMAGIGFSWSRSMGSLGYITEQLISALPATAWCVFALLSNGASRLAEDANSLSRLKRCVHLGVFLVLCGLSYLLKQDFIYVMTAIVGLFMILDAMTERVNLVPTAYSPFYRSRGLGKIGLIFLSPSWPSGVNLSFFVTAVFGGLLLQYSHDEMAVMVYTLCCCSFWMIFTVVVMAFSHSKKDLLGPLLLFAGLLVLLSFLVYWMHQSAGGNRVWMYLLPITSLISISAHWRHTLEHAALIYSTALLWPLLLSLLSWMHWRRIRPVLEIARVQAAA